MDKIYKRNVDVFQINVKYTEGAKEKPSFSDLLLNPELTENDLKVKGKLISYQVLEKTEDYIIGLVETNRSDNIPPLKRRKEKKIEQMDLPEGDGLAFGNVFYFDIKRNVILYEVNKNGCIFAHFLVFLYRKLKAIRKNYSVNFYPVLTSEQNEKLQKMSTKTKIELEISHPKKIASDQVKNKSTMFFLFNKGAALDTTTLKLTFSTRAIHGESLKSSESDEVIKEILDQVKMDQVEMEHLKIYGYVDDSDDNKLQVIDLVTERLKGIIELREPRLASNLLEFQRLSQIKSLFEKLESELITIFGE